MDLFEDDTPVTGDNTPEFTVSEISGAVRKVIEGALGYVRIRGEVGRVVLARSGHLYYDLKDDKNVLGCMTWKGQVSGLSVMPEEGMEVIAEGKMTSSGFQSKYSLNATRLTIAGEGALMAMLEKRKKALAAEGLFDDARKQPIPFLPEIIGVVTSPQGAVIRDILHRLRDRFPRKVLVWPVAVQGKDCAPQVARAIAGFNALSPGGSLPRPDLLIVARGGGAIEDLWGFNEEAVARAAAASDIPLISAVGHETDTTLIDFVSDKRAPTPTAAAELAVPVRMELLAWAQGQEARLSGTITRLLDGRKQRVIDLARALPNPQMLVGQAQQRIDLLGTRLPQALIAGVQLRRAALSERSASLRPQVLSRHLKAEAARLESLERRRAPALARRTAEERRRFEALSARLRPVALLQETARRRDMLERSAAQLRDAMQRRLLAPLDRLEALGRLHQTLGYRATLERGYAVVRSEDTVVTRKAQAAKSSTLEIEFADGKLTLGAAAPAKPKAQPKPKPKPEDQGTLF